MQALWGLAKAIKPADLQEAARLMARKADLHKKLGLIECQMGDLDRGEKELRLAQALKPSDPDIERALDRIAAVR